MSEATNILVAILSIIISWLSLVEQKTDYISHWQIKHYIRATRWALLYYHLISRPGSDCLCHFVFGVIWLRKHFKRIELYEQNDWSNCLLEQSHQTSYRNRETEIRRCLHRLCWNCKIRRIRKCARLDRVNRSYKSYEPNPAKSLTQSTIWCALESGSDVELSKLKIWNDMQSCYGEKGFKGGH